ncbi:MAG: trypsin-like peptidase domain-containing protein [Clostridia bacterium]|nr:trypsin-like peptidase domain-containing protein [Clostridia bacterium]
MSEKEFENEFNENEITKSEETAEAKEPSEYVEEKKEEAPSIPNTYGGFSEKWNYERREEKAKKKGSGIKVLAITMSLLFVITLTAFTTYYVSNEFPDYVKDKFSKGDSYDSNEKSSVVGVPIDDKLTIADGSTIREIIPEYSGEELTSQEIIALAKPSVVGIKTMIEEYYSFYGTQTYEGVGSGFIITEDGYVVTNYHVIEGAVSVKVILSDGTEYDAETVGYDALSDVAVLKIEAEKLPALVIGNSDAVIAGDTVIAIGCPSGIDLAGTATRGMVSMVDREIEITDYYGRTQKVMKVIQIDAAINPGNSGGPLLNSRGEVIGINTLKLSSTGYEGIGFALPINGVMNLVDQICENGAVVERPADSFVTGKAALGITYREITKAESRQYKLPQGVLIVFLSQGGAAQKSGMKSGDVIVEFDGKEITTDDELISMIDAKKPGDVVKVKVYRDGEYLELDVTLAEASE